MRRKSLLRILTVMLVLIALLWGIILYVYINNNSKSDYYGIVYEREAPEVTLTDQDGSKVNVSDFKGKVVLLFFGYTHCPDICPMTMSVMSSVMDKMGDKAERVQVVFITVDPERDTQEKLKRYVPYYNENFIGLTGTPEEIDKVADDYNIFYSKEEIQSPSDYLMGHNSSVLLISPDGDIFLAEDIERIL